MAGEVPCKQITLFRRHLMEYPPSSAGFLHSPIVYVIYSQSGYSIEPENGMMNAATPLESDEIMEYQIGKQIKKARNLMGMTGEELAERCNISTTYLRQLEGGKKTPSIQMLEALCRELRVSPNYLLPGMGTSAEATEQEELIMAVQGMAPEQIRAIASAIKTFRRELGL